MEFCGVERGAVRCGTCRAEVGEVADELAGFGVGGGSVAEFIPDA